MHHIAWQVLVAPGVCSFREPLGCLPSKTAPASCTATASLAGENRCTMSEAVSVLRMRGQKSLILQQDNLCLSPAGYSVLCMYALMGFHDVSMTRVV